MKLENQVCTLEQAKQLKELGIAVSSLFVHVDNMELGYEGLKLASDTKSHKLNKGLVADSGVVRYYAAFTAAELGAILPAELEPWTLQIDKHEGEGWQVGYEDSSNFSKWLSAVVPTMAGAMAETLIQLLENEEVTAEEVNARLSS